MHENDHTMKQLRDALSLCDADYCDIRFENRRSLQIITDDQGKDQLDEEHKNRGYIRAFCKGAWAQESFDSPDDLEERLSELCRQARSEGDLKQGLSHLAAVPVVKDTVLLESKCHPSSYSLEEKHAQLQEYRRLALSFQDIVRLDLYYTDANATLWFANSEGSAIRQERVDMRCMLAAHGERNGQTVTESISLGSALHIEELFHQQDALADTCRLVQSLLDASPIPVGNYPVICSNRIAGVLFHEAFGHACEASLTYYEKGISEGMKLGRRIAEPILSIYDSGENLEQRGGLIYDDEGVLCQRRDLLKKGILVGHLHNRESALVLGEEPAGNARAVDCTFPPIPRMRITCIEPGPHSFADMLEGIEFGLYICGSNSGYADKGHFHIQFGHAYIIRQGKLCELVRGGLIEGDIFDTLAKIDRVGKELSHGSGMCGKAGQINLPVGMSTPQIRFRNLQVKRAH